MPLSTSSSDHSELSETKQRLKIGFKTALAGMLLFGVVVGLFMPLGEWVGSQINGRMLGQLAFLKTFVDEDGDKKKVIFFGSSMVQAGFEPLLFDRLMKEQGVATASANYGIANLNPSLQLLITHHIKSAFQEADQHLDLALIEFNPFQVTKVRKEFVMMNEQSIAVLETPENLWRITLEDPTRGIRLFTIRYLRRGFSAELVTSGAAMALVTPPLGSNPAFKAANEKSGILKNELDAALAKDGLKDLFGTWMPATRGGRVGDGMLSESTEQALKAFAASRRDPALLQADQQRRIDLADILEMRYDQELLDAFIEMIKDFQAVSNHVEVVLLPRNTDWINYPSEGRARLDAMLKQITDATGVKIADYQVREKLPPEVFLDTTHLSPYDGSKIFTEMLVNDYAGTIAP